MVFIDVMAGGLVDPYIHLRINFILLNYRGVAFGALLLLSTLDELIDICISWSFLKHWDLYMVYRLIYFFTHFFADIDLGVSAFPAFEISIARTGDGG